MSSDFPHLTVADARKILKQYSVASYAPKSKNAAMNLKPLDDRLEFYSYPQLRQALAQVVQNSEYQILGICAETAQEGLAALADYSLALGYEPPPDLNPIEGAVYIKFNPRVGVRYISAYDGHERGVLVSCQSPNSEGINEMYGHLPIDLFTDRSQDSSSR